LCGQGAAGLKSLYVFRQVGNVQCPLWDFVVIAAGGFAEIGKSDPKLL
jgi:hypothetical protein